MRDPLSSPPATLFARCCSRNHNMKRNYMRNISRMFILSYYVLEFLDWIRAQASIYFPYYNVPLERAWIVDVGMVKRGHAIYRRNLRDSLGKPSLFWFFLRGTNLEWIVQSKKMLKFQMIHNHDFHKCMSKMRAEERSLLSLMLCYWLGKTRPSLWKLMGTTPTNWETPNLCTTSGILKFKPSNSTGKQNP